MIDMFNGMKMRGFFCKGILFCFFLSCLCFMQAQVPSGFSFQAVVRDNQGQLASDRVVNIRLSVLQGGDEGREVYAENHSVRSNSHGLVSLVVGNGSGASSDFSAIDWASGPYFLKVEADAEGGMDYQLVATTQLLSVPYALHSLSAQNLTGTIPFSQLTDVPDTLGFGGSWNDLTDKPELFSGSWNDLTDVPEGLENVFSGRYEDLEGKPSLRDTVTAYGFSGQYADLEGLPEMFSGRYEDLEGKPTFRDTIAAYGFSGQYVDLQGKPSYTRDSLPIWNTLLDYRLLQNRPTIAEGGFDGDYNNLYNTPDIGSIAAGTTRQMLDTLSYPALKRLPVFQDSVEKYGFSGRYSDLSGTPDLAALIVTEYGQLGGLPNLRDTVYKYMYVPDTTQEVVSSWNDLADKPVFRDSVEKYGFSGDYADLDNRPQGQNEGDLLYWSNEQWTVLPMGQEGQMLTIAGGRLAWIDPSFASTAANTYKVGEVYEENGVPQGVVVEVSSAGRYAKIAALKEYRSLAWSSLALDQLVATGAASQTDGASNANVIRGLRNWESDYPVFAKADSLGEGWYVPSVSEMDLLYSARALTNAQLQETEGADLLSSSLYWTSTEMASELAYVYLFVDSTFVSEETGMSLPLTGGQAYEDSKREMHALRPFKRLTWAEATSKPETGKLYRVGDIYINPRTSQAEGVVYKIADGGLHGWVVGMGEHEGVWEDASGWATDSAGGWRLPDAEEMEAVLQQRYVINASMANCLQGWSGKVEISDEPYSVDSPGGGKEVTGSLYWTSVSVDASTCNVLYFDQDGVLRVMAWPWGDKAKARRIKEF